MKVIEVSGSAPISKIAQEITEMILSETFLNKDALQPRIEALIRIFYHKHVAPRSGDNPHKKASYQKTIHKIQFEERYWRGVLKNIISKEEMQRHYNTVNEATKDMLN